MSSYLTSSFTDLYFDDINRSIPTGGGRVRDRIKHIKAWNALRHTLAQSPSTITDISATDRKIWLWSDMHFGHTKVIRYAKRPFDDTKAMEDLMVDNYNRVVGEGDIVIWGGDFSFYSTEESNRVLARCNKGHNILVIGNHDFSRSKFNYVNFDEITFCIGVERKGILYAITHYPMYNLPEPIINIHGHLHTYSKGAANTSLQHINMNVEYTDYAPRLFSDIQAQSVIRITSMET